MCDIQTNKQMNRQIRKTNIYLSYLFNNLNLRINSFNAFINMLAAMQPLVFMASHVGLHTIPANKVVHVMPRLTYARWCACPAYHINKPQYIFVS